MAKKKTTTNAHSIWQSIKVIETKEITKGIRLTNGHWFLPNGSQIHISKVKKYKSMKQKTKDALNMTGIILIALLGTLANSLIICGIIALIALIIIFLTH